MQKNTKQKAQKADRGKIRWGVASGRHVEKKRKKKNMGSLKPPESSLLGKTKVKGEGKEEENPLLSKKPFAIKL